eukprot:gnl/TRDRNA2_/TRDRNA2_166805_c2_seq2.p1 gnl/TRDRNA2_/TRDRNA2_166805_c2~~gnl/TRDRNA2_/TRDRNA2_166805_c2_seq2.p1  ORF type:complete len:160 (-),score=25.51 gnl/TRDRNA2_/TRDRNA2_166805_c2_seq2:271-750(-)
MRHGAQEGNDDTDAKFYEDLIYWTGQTAPNGETDVVWSSLSSLVPPGERNEHQQERWKETSVRCISPASLLKEAAMEPSTIDILEVDTEGYDLIILNHFLKLEGFHPYIISFEWVHIDRSVSSGEFAAVLDTLSSKGYTMYGQAFDIFAIARHGRKDEL